MTQPSAKYIHMPYRKQSQTQGTKTRHIDKTYRPNTEQRHNRHTTRPTVTTQLVTKHFSSHQGSVLPYASKLILVLSVLDN